MNEQERADLLSQEIDRLLDGTSVSGDDPLLQIASQLRQLPLQPSAKATQTFEKQIDQWFGATRTVRKDHRRKSSWPVVLFGLAAAALLLFIIGAFILSNLQQNSPPTTAIANLPTFTQPAIPANTTTPTIPPGIAPSPTYTVVVTQLAINCGNDDSAELPIYLDIVGEVRAATDSAIRVNEMTIHLPNDMSSASYSIGKSTQIRANLCNNDTLIATAPDNNNTPIPVGTPVIAPLPTLINTPTGCAATTQPLAALLSTTYDISYAELVGWHCQGVDYGVVTRAYIIAKANPATDVKTILTQRTQGKNWNSIVSTLSVTPTAGNNQSNSSPGNSGTAHACNDLRKADDPAYDANCKNGKDDKDPKPPKKK